ncbi:YidH family protein [Pimelobacter simplex]|uniref:YidH family protein n=1 Tax=Nocardioides simplex TaxID=2045 RepID=UPI003AADE85F
MNAPATSGEAEHEPDYRFTLANERTFLAWIRTALALVAGGVAVRQVSVTSDAGEVLVVLLAVTCLGTALLLAVGARSHWSRAQAAIRRGRPLPGTRLVPTLALCLAVLAAAGLALLAVP